MRGDDAEERARGLRGDRGSRGRRGGRLLLALVVLLVAGLVAWAVLDPAPDDTPPDDADASGDVALLGPDLSEAGLHLDEDGDPPSSALGLRRTHLAEVDAEDRSTNITLGTGSGGMELARFAVLWCDMPPEASSGIVVPSGTITVQDVELEVPCIDKEGTPPVRGMVALPLTGTAILEVTGDLPSSGTATLAVYTEPTDSFTDPRPATSDAPAPAVPPGAVAVDEEHAIPSLFGATRSRLVEIDADSRIRVYAPSTGRVTVTVDGTPVTDDGDVAAMALVDEVPGHQLDDPDIEETIEAVQTDRWRTQEPDLRMGEWLVHSPGAQRTFPVPEALRPAEGQRGTVAVQVTVPGEDARLPQVVVTDAGEVADEDVARLEPVPLDRVDDEAPVYAQGTRLAAAWTVPQDGVLRLLPELPGTDDGPTWLVATRSGSGHEPQWGYLTGGYWYQLGTAIVGDEVVPLQVFETSLGSPSDIGMGWFEELWGYPAEDRWRQPEGRATVVLPPSPGHPTATVLAYADVPYDEFDFTGAPSPSWSWRVPDDAPDGLGPPWGPTPPLLDTVTEADLEDGELTVELDGDAERLWISTDGAGRMQLLRDGVPLSWEPEDDGWWSSWTDQAVTTEVPFPPMPGTLQVRVEGYEEGFRIEVRGRPG